MGAAAVSATRESQALDAVIQGARSVDFAEREIRRLREIEAWAVDSLPLRDGDEVVLAEPVTFGPGWKAYREVLVVGRTGVVSSIFLSGGEWAGLFTPDDCWCLSDFRGQRLATEPKSFMVRLGKLRKRADGDERMPVPDDIIERREAQR